MNISRVIFGITGSVSAFVSLEAAVMNITESTETLKRSSFNKSVEVGWIAPIQTSYASFMGAQLTIVIERGGFAWHTITVLELEQANRAMKALPASIKEAEKQLRAYAGSDNVASSSDISNPHVWISTESDDVNSWTLVVEMADNDGYGWHIQFCGEKFQTIWAGS